MKHRFKASLLALLSLSLLVACGGGGGASSSTGSQPTILGITVATGAPVVGAQVTVVDSQGNSEDCSEASNSEGKLSCALSTARTPPYFIRAQQKSLALYAVVPDTASSVNVTPVSAVMAKKFASDNGLEPSVILGNPDSMKTTNKDSAQAAVDLVNAIVKVIAKQTANITIDNALTQTYTPTNTNDVLDKFVHNINISTDVTGINLSIPTSAGTVGVSIAYNTPTATATSTVTRETANVSANLSDAEAINAVFSSFITKLKTCSGSSTQRSQMVAEVSGTYMNGQTIPDWVTRICDIQLPVASSTYTRSLARFGNKSINAVGIKTDNGDIAEMTFAFVKEAGAWKLLADNMPVNMSLKTRHALTYQADDSKSGLQQTTMQYERYIDTWIDDDSKRQIAGALPQKIELYAIDMKDAGVNWQAKNFPINPDITIYRNTNCGNQYTAYANKCDSFARESDYSSLIKRLENSDYTLIVMKLKDSAGNCTNCDLDGIPTSGSVIGRAYTFESLFGTSITAAQLFKGVYVSDLPTSFDKNARVYFAMPTTLQLQQITADLMSKSLTNKVNIPWQRATGKNQQIDGVWAGVNSCSPGSNWTNLDEPTDSFKLSSDKWEFTYKPSSKTFNNASWVSFTIANRVNESEFAFYINANRNVNCVP